jgi:hypothetical protein
VRTGGGLEAVGAVGGDDLEGVAAQQRGLLDGSDEHVDLAHLLVGRRVGLGLVVVEGVGAQDAPAPPPVAQHVLALLREVARDQDLLLHTPVQLLLPPTATATDEMSPRDDDAPTEKKVGLGSEGGRGVGACLLVVGQEGTVGRLDGFHPPLHVRLWHTPEVMVVVVVVEGGCHQITKDL